MPGGANSTGVGHADSRVLDWQGSPGDPLHVAAADPGSPVCCETAITRAGRPAPAPHPARSRQQLACSFGGVLPRGCPRSAQQLAVTETAAAAAAMGCIASLLRPGGGRQPGPAPDKSEALAEGWGSGVARRSGAASCALRPAPSPHRPVPAPLPCRWPCSSRCRAERQGLPPGRGCHRHPEDFGGAHGTRRGGGGRHHCSAGGAPAAGCRQLARPAAGLLRLPRRASAHPPSTCYRTLIAVAAHDG